MTRYLMNTATGSVDTEDNWRSEMSDWEGDQQAQFDALVEVTITPDDEDGICEWFNCITASVDADGDVWVDKLDRGHWLSDEQKARYLAWRGQP